MTGSPYSQAQILLIKAAEDEAALHVDGNPESILGFHAQQAVEKLIKALLSSLSVPFELTQSSSISVSEIIPILRYGFKRALNSPNQRCTCRQSVPIRIQQTRFRSAQRRAQDSPARPLSCSGRRLP